MDKKITEFLNSLATKIDNHQLGFDAGEAFEKEIANYFNVKYALITSTCTSAIFLSLKGLGIGQSDEVIVPDSTYPASVSPVEHSGAIPIFCDGDSYVGGLDPHQIESKITSLTKGIIVVHQHGYPCNMPPILKIAKKYNLPVIEDTARAFGAVLNNIKCGTFGLAGCLSFNTMKILSANGGGAIITDNKKLYERCKILRGYGNDVNKDFVAAGYNYQLPMINSLIGLTRIGEIDERVKNRRLLADYLTKKIKRIRHIELPTETKGSYCVYPIYPIIIPGGNIKDFRLFLKSHNIVTHSSHSLHAEPYFRNKYSLKAKSYPNSKYFNEHLVCLHWSDSYEYEYLDLVADKVVEYFSAIKKLK